MMDGGMMAGMGLWMALVAATLVAILVFVVLGSVWLVRRLRGRNTATRETPQELLRRRYAAGEIDDAEFERRLAALTWQ